MDTMSVISDNDPNAFAGPSAPCMVDLSGHKVNTNDILALTDESCDRDDEVRVNIDSLQQKELTQTFMRRKRKTVTFAQDPMVLKKTRENVSDVNQMRASGNHCDDDISLKDLMTL